MSTNQPFTILFARVSVLVCAAAFTGAVSVLLAGALPAAAQVLEPDEPPYVTPRAYSSAGALLWEYDAGAPMWDVATDGANNAVVLGLPEGGSGDSLYKLDSGGSLLWSTAAQGRSVAIDSAGNIVTGGANAIQYNANGQMVWSAPAFFTEAVLVVDPADNVVVAGTRYDDGETVIDGTSLVKYSSSGELLWGPIEVGRPYGRSVVTDASGNIFVAVLLGHDPSEGIFGTAVRIVKYAPDGELLWRSESLGVSRDYNQLAVDSGNDVLYTTNGGYLYKFEGSSGARIWWVAHGKDASTNISLDSSNNIIFGWGNRALIFDTETEEYRTANPYGVLRKYSPDAQTLFWEKPYPGVYGTVSGAGGSAVVAGYRDTATGEPPEVDLTVYDTQAQAFTDGPVTVLEGEAVQLAWTVEGATLCTASAEPLAAGGWEGPKAFTAGIEFTDPLEESAVFVLTCENDAGDAVTDSVSVTVVETELEVALSASPASGQAPLAVVLSASPSGTAPEPYQYTFRCSAGEAYSSPQASNEFECVYSSSGTREAGVRVVAANDTEASDSTGITVGPSSGSGSGGGSPGGTASGEGSGTDDDAVVCEAVSEDNNTAYAEVNSEVLWRVLEPEENGNYSYLWQSDTEALDGQTTREVSVRHLTVGHKSASVIVSGPGQSFSGACDINILITSLPSFRER